MILAIDVGNSHTVVGCIEEGKILDISRIRTLPRATDMEYIIKLQSLLEFHHRPLDGFEGAIISSVVPQVTEKLVEAVRALLKLETLVVGPGIKTGINVRIDDPSTLGGDLLVGSVAAMEYYSLPAIVMDLGTATTIMVVDGKGAYRGGAILPGVLIGLEALASGTSLLPHIAIVPPEKAIGTNTVDAMRSGAVFGTAATLDGMIDRMEAELGEKCCLIATGGLASAIVPHCTHEIICDDDLLLRGLWALYQKNR